MYFILGKIALRVNQNQKKLVQTKTKNLVQFFNFVN